MKKLVGRVLRSQAAKLIPGLILFGGYLWTRDFQILTFAVAFTLWPTLRSLREG